MERADNNGKPLGKREPDTPRPDRDLESAISEEAARDGKMLVTVSGSEKIRDQLRMIVPRKISPWEIYEKVINLDLNRPVNVAQGKTRHAGLVAVRAFPFAAAKKALYMQGRVRHSNIVEALDAFTTETSLYIVLDLPRSNPRQVLDGLVYLESEGLEHGSLSCPNIMVSAKGDVKIANQQCCDKPRRNREPRDVRALGIITMELMQKYTQDDGAVGVDNKDRWPSDSDAVTFLAETTSAASARELRKLRSPFQPTATG
ncbi:hypothetical protein V490_00368 [Pseudogymnoascus sp. VKM F-3557]|nr:hypothetical protein V490_00368 [Pseudogymnoascus sp. VKM F-3557]